jgi:Na+/H+ antiporter NhaD/arsenite permease-like protein
MQFFLITIVTIILDFLTHSFSKQLSNKIDDKRYIKVHIHHSVWGVLLLAIGIIIGNKAVMAIGVGLYIGHVMEEIYFNKRNFITALFIFISR